MDGYAIQRFDRCREIAKINGLDLIVTGKSFTVKNSKGIMLGVMYSVDEVYHYLCGYDQGASDGKFQGGIRVCC